VRRRARRGWRILEWVGIVAGALAVLGLALFAFLFTTPGERLLKRVADNAMERGLHERVEIGGLEFHGDRVVLHQIEAKSFGANEVSVDVAVRSLLGGRLRLDALAMKGYRLRVQRPAAQQQEGEVPDFAIDAISLKDGVLEVPSDTGDVQVRIEGISITGAIAHRDRRWTGDLKVNGQMTAPQQVPLMIAAGASAEGALQTARLVASAGASRIDASARLPLDRRGRPLLDQLDGTLELDVPSFRHADFTYGPVRASARFDRGQLQVDALQAQLPGLSAERDSSGQGAFSGVVRLQDLATTVKAIEALTGRATPALRGRGELRVRLDNPITSAGLAVKGTLPSLGWPGGEGRQVTLDGRVADLSRPTDGQLTANVAQVDVGSQQLKAISVEVKSERERGSLNATIAQPVKATLQVEIAHAHDEKPVLLEKFVLTWPGATWTNTGPPGRIRVGETGVVIDSLTLASGAQKIALQGAWGPAQRDMSLSLTAIQLEGLPEALLPKDLDPAGQVDGQLKVIRPRKQLEGSISLNVTQARLAGLTGLSARLNAHAVNGRVGGTVAGAALQGTVDGRFDLPMSGGPGAKVAASLTLENASVPSAWTLIEPRLSRETANRLKNPSGRLGAWLELTGTSAEPKLNARIALDEGELTVEGTGRFRAISVHGEADLTRRQIRIPSLLVRAEEGRLEISGSANRTDPSRPFQYRLKLAAERFPLPLEEPMQATFKANLDGTASAERITSKVSFSTLRLERLPKKASSPSATRGYPLSQCPPGHRGAKCLLSRSTLRIGRRFSRC
jgi:hypothetical protein